MSRKRFKKIMLMILILIGMYIVTGCQKIISNDFYNIRLAQKL